MRRSLHAAVADTPVEEILSGCSSAARCAWPAPGSALHGPHPVPRMSSRFSNVATAIVASCCVIVTVLTLRRELAPASSRRAVPALEPVADWRSYASTGHREGRADAPVTIVEFSDFQCPFCRRLHDTLRELKQEYPGLLSTVYRHYPLERLHPHARTAALAAECAAGYGRFGDLADALFSLQDSIGLVSWNRYAVAAGITDTIEFARCVRDTLHVGRLRTDQDAGKRLRVTGTPTVLVNEWRIMGGGKDVLRRLIDDELRERRGAAAGSGTSGR